eukprot:gene41994-31205_t
MQRGRHVRRGRSQRRVAACLRPITAVSNRPSKAVPKRRKGGTAVGMNSINSINSRKVCMTHSTTLMRRG